MSSIRILPEAVANQIAAGEVVERPASVVKELIENALDAGAERIEVSVEGGGKRRVRVVDDGSGMSHDDVLLSFERHATSKIRSAEDLLEIATLGFRGEALPSIAAVSRLLLETRTASEASGTRVEIAGGKLRDVKEVAWPGGTSVEVRDLFFNTPARRKFLKSESTELGHIATLVTHYALAHPEKNFRLTSLTNELLNVSPVSTLRERLYQVMGGQLLEQLVEMPPAERPILAPVAAESDSEDAAPGEVPVARLTGFVSRPEVQRLNRNQIYFFVNRRLVRDRLILHAITEAYRNILPAGVFPVALIFLELPAREVDVNVHPSKIEVRFRHAAFIHDFARDSIRQALIAARPIAVFPASRRPPAQPFSEEDAEVGERLKEEPPLMRSGGVSSERDAPAVETPSQLFRLSSPAPMARSGTLPLDVVAPPPAGGKSSPEPLVPGEALDVSQPETLAPSIHDPLATVEAPSGGCDAELRPATSSSAGEFPADLQPLGQVQESFIVATNADGLWIIDQHVAHERVLFEQHLKLRREKKVEVQRLLLPIVVELQPDQQVVFREMAEELVANGFEVEPFGHRTIAVKTAPAAVSSENVERLLLAILDGVGREVRALSLDDLHARIAASVACHAAIKVNMRLDRNKMTWLLHELGRTECPMACPHGRPVVLRYGIKEIYKAFKRL